MSPSEEALDALTEALNFLDAQVRQGTLLGYALAVTASDGEGFAGYGGDRAPARDAALALSDSFGPRPEQD